ncbi:MAG: nucleotide sugar dehydrogenase [Kiritimatiellae bacterium]|nr:nucleotide sugar dehydrogenase [Kiritimatiellia bacterium]
MKIGVYGLWHLGCVTAACLAEKGHRVIGLALDESLITDLQSGKPPIAEPGLSETIRAGLDAGTLRFTCNLSELADADLLWVTFDTPVNDDDQADTEYVFHRIQEALPHLREGAVVLVSSQMPVGSIAQLEKAAAPLNKHLHFACSPENLRLGKALEVFLHPDRIVAGARSEEARALISEALAPITDRILWMSPESAEMAKHAINSFLALSVAYANELAALCEVTGADAKEVEAALKSEQRIGPGAYLSPGPAFAGGTLARDVAFLNTIGARDNLTIPLIAAIRPSNDHHRGWIHRKISSIVGNRRDASIAVWGLTYKPGTDTLRRSSSVELCRKLRQDGFPVRAHDPAFNELPNELDGLISFHADPLEACRVCDLLVIATPWPLYRDLPADAVAQALAPGATVIDASRFLAQTLGKNDHLNYLTIGGCRS